MLTQIQKNIEFLSNYYNQINYVAKIKTGKEAEVHLLEIDSKLYALKVYKTHKKYSSKGEYLTYAEVGDKRIARAIKNKSRTGKSAMDSSWTNREFKIMKELYHFLDNIPEVFYATENAILMEYLGDATNPAPRLEDVLLEYEKAKLCFDEIIESYLLFLDQGFIHGDFSSFNILWYKEKAYIIDFPQIVYIKNNPNAQNKFFKDIENIERYFSKYNLQNLSAGIKKLRDKFFEIKYFGI